MYYTQTIYLTKGYYQELNQQIDPYALTAKYLKNQVNFLIKQSSSYRYYQTLLDVNSKASKSFISNHLKYNPEIKTLSNDEYKSLINKKIKTLHLDYLKTVDLDIVKFNQFLTESFNKKNNFKSQQKEDHKNNINHHNETF